MKVKMEKKKIQFTHSNFSLIFIHVSNLPSIKFLNFNVFCFWTAFPINCPIMLIFDLYFATINKHVEEEISVFPETRSFQLPWITRFGEWIIKQTSYIKAWWSHSFVQMCQCAKTLILFLLFKSCLSLLQFYNIFLKNRHTWDHKFFYRDLCFNIHFRKNWRHTPHTFSLMKIVALALLSHTYPP